MKQYFKYSLYSPMLENVGLNVYNCGYQQCSGGHSWGPAVRDHYLIHLVVSGKGVYNVDGQDYKLSKGSAFIIRPQSLVSYYADEKDPWEYCWVGFNGADASRLVDLTAFEEGNNVISIGEAFLPQLHDAFISIYSSLGTAAEQETLTVSKLFEAFSMLIKAAPSKKPDSSSGRLYIKNAVKFIQRNFSDNIDITDIAAQVGLSRSHLYRIFIKHLSLSPNEYLTQYRINQACVLLRTSGLSVGEIASSVGFDDQLYFSRVFKKVKGVPPSQYIKEIKDTKQFGDK
ncbi:MAG: AraC family transcriptional regulator [Oscillospiraceae bacterium]|nr:AraC family transcriptional regulator [Oscillospiraceae bacterium]